MAAIEYFHDKNHKGGIDMIRDSIPLNLCFEAVEVMSIMVKSCIFFVVENVCFRICGDNNNLFNSCQHCEIRKSAIYDLKSNDTLQLIISLVCLST